MTRVSDVMTRGVRTMPPSETIMKAAQAMDELNVGSIPVCDGQTLVGIVTDRDIVLRGVAQGCAADGTPLSAVMSANMRWCYEDQPLEEAAEQMREAQIRRIPVVDRDRHLVGMLSLGDVATKADGGQAQRTLEQVSEPSVPDRSAQSSAAGPAGGGASKKQTQRKAR